MITSMFSLQTFTWTLKLFYSYDESNTRPRLTCPTPRWLRRYHTSLTVTSCRRYINLPWFLLGHIVRLKIKEATTNHQYLISCGWACYLVETVNILWQHFRVITVILIVISEKSENVITKWIINSCNGGFVDGVNKEFIVNYKIFMYSYLYSGCTKHV